MKTKTKSLDFDANKKQVKVEEDSFFYDGDNFTQEFDHYVRFDFSSLLPNATVPCNGVSGDFYSNKPIRKIKRLVKLIHKAMPERFERLAVKRVCGSEDEFKGASHFVIGFVTTKNWTNPLTVGPQANTKEAQEFRSFWGDRSELRKFADSQICECVVWGQTAYNFAAIRVIEYLVEKMLELPKSTAEWRSALPKILQINGDEIDQINKVFGSLSMDLRTMKNLPLIVTNIHGISPYLRGTEPPLPSIFVSEQNCEVSEDETHRVPSRDKLPRYTPVVTVHLKLEHSTKWGSDLDAIQGLTSSFYLQMAKEFQRLNTFSVPTENQLFVMRENIVFELVIVHDRIGTLLESFIEKQKSQGVQVETELILKLQDYRKRFIYDSALQASLFSFAVVHKTFPDVVRIMKRWLGAKLLSGHIPDLVLELLCAAVFIDSSQTQPRSAWAAFRRVLQLLTTHNWTAQPLLVDLDQAWDEEQITDMRKSFVKMRPVLPPMVIMTNEDTVGSRWSYGGPSPLILKRMIGLAKDTVAVLDNHIESDMALKLTDALMFRDLSPYDCVIEIRDEAVVRELAPEQENEETEKEQKTKEGNLDKALPVVDFDPVSDFVDSLRDKFADSALFFYDKYSPHAIGVKFKPSQNQATKSDFHQKKLVTKIRRLGEGLIKEIREN